MKITFKARDWHNWISVILLVPMLLVGMTAIFISHKKALDLDDVDLSRYVAWLPGYGAAKAEKPELRASLATGDGRRWIAGKEGLYRIAGETAEPVAAFAGTQVRGLATAAWGVVAAAKNGVWLERDGVWERVYKGDAWSAVANPDGSVTVALKDKGLLASADGKRWSAESSPAVAAVQAAMPTAGGERVTLGKLVMDLHTGKAFFGKEAEWIWIDLLGFVWVFLGFTGLYLWWRTQTKRRDAARKQWEILHG
ncbi:MAG: PepSY domain-containing protein [Sterolibacteriaceae bacterium MAG5]|nr:PepSY domain-containing protein [Candidatus Nitricoxidireducens bremensis]